MNKLVDPSDVDLKFNMLSLNVSNLDPSIKFYCYGLGFKVLEMVSEPNLLKVYLSLANSWDVQLCLIQDIRKKEFVPQSVLSFRPSVLHTYDAALKTLSEAGVEFKEIDTDSQLMQGGRNRSRRFFDMEDSCLEIQEQTPAEFMHHPTATSKLDLSLKDIDREFLFGSYCPAQFDLVLKGIGLNVTDIDQQTQFYSEFLGLPHISTRTLTLHDIAVDFLINPVNDITLYLNGSVVKLWPDHAHINFDIEPIFKKYFEDIYFRLREIGIIPKPFLPDNDPLRMKAVFFQDPDNYSWCLRNPYPLK